jgi:hypothetical protein
MEPIDLIETIKAVMIRLQKVFAFVAVSTLFIVTASRAQSSYPAYQQSEIDTHIENCKTYLQFSQDQFNFIIDELKYLARVKAERASLPAPFTTQDTSHSATATSELAKAYDGQIGKIEAGLTPKRKLLAAINYLLMECISTLPQPRQK